MEPRILHAVLSAEGENSLVSKASSCCPGNILSCRDVTASQATPGRSLDHGLESSVSAWQPLAHQVRHLGPGDSYVNRESQVSTSKACSAPLKGDLCHEMNSCTALNNTSLQRASCSPDELLQCSCQVSLKSCLPGLISEMLNNHLLFL